MKHVSLNMKPHISNAVHFKQKESTKQEHHKEVILSMELQLKKNP